MPQILRRPTIRTIRGSQLAPYHTQLDYQWGHHQDKEDLLFLAVQQHRSQGKINLIQGNLHIKMRNITFLVMPDSRSSWPQNQTVQVVIAVIKRETHPLTNFKNWIIKSLCMKLGLMLLLIKFHQLAGQLEGPHPRQAQAQLVEAHTFPHQQQLFPLHIILVEITEGLCRMSREKWQPHHSPNSIHQLETGEIQLKF